MRRILYFCPDFPQPSGGIKTLYRHVDRLCQLGFDAYIVHQQHGFTLTWHDYQAPVIWLEDKPQFGPDDMCVFPEVMLDYIRQTQGFAGQRVVFALSWSPAYARLRPGERWQDYGITQVITKSPVVKRHLEWSMSIDVTLIGEYVDATRYVYEPRRKQPKVAYLTRKDASGEWLHGVLARRHASLAALIWQPLRNMPEETYAGHLREASVYLATTTQEGMNVSVLEAMACGCLVVGYAGVGGATYMAGTGEAQNCILVENGNLPLLGETLEAVLLKLVADPQCYASVIEQAVVSARRYQDPAAETQGLQAFFEKLGA